MRTFETDKPFLLALSQGLVPHAESLVCDDLRGADSLFGEGVKTPRPTRSFCYCGSRNGDCMLPGSRPGIPDDDDGLVLWESSASLSPEDAAMAIVKREPKQSGHASFLSVPSRVFLAGRSSSTFDLGWQLLEDGFFPEWSSVICSCQTSGRGQLRRQWHSPRGNLYVTFRLPGHPAFSGDAASVIVGYLVVRAFRSLGFPLKLKWPNDLILDESIKVGGILLEERKGVLLAGLGVNLSEVPSEAVLRKGHALRAGKLLSYHSLAGGRESDGETGSFFDRDEPLAPFPLWKYILCGLILEYARTLAKHGLEYVIADLNGNNSAVLSGMLQQTDPSAIPMAASMAGDGPDSPLLVWKGRRVLLSDEDTGGLLLGVGSGGGLLLQLPGGREGEFFSGSLSLFE